MVDHPGWCQRARCRAEEGGPHVGGSVPIEAGLTRVATYLRQMPDERRPQLMLSVGHRANGLTVPLSAAASVLLSDQLDELAAALRQIREMERANPGP